MKRLAGLFLLMLVVHTSVLQGQNKISITLKPDSIRVGELAEMTWQFEAPEGFKVSTMPAFPDSCPSGIEVVKKQDVVSEQKGAGTLYRQQIMVSSYDSGRFALPVLSALLVKGSDTLEFLSDSLFLFSTTVPVDTTTAVKDVKDIMEVNEEPSNAWLWYVLGGIALALLALAVYWFLKKRRKNKPVQEQKVITDPYGDTLSKLRKMQENRTWFTISPKDFYTELIEILRKYLLLTRGIQAEEMLSSELIEAVIGVGLPASAVARLNSVLQVADMAKFAKYKPEPGTYEKSVSEAIGFVEETRPVEDKSVENGLVK